MSSREFIAAFGAVTVARTGRERSPADVLAQWEQTVSLVEAGYDGDFFEFDNDMSIRDLIDAVLADEGVMSHVEARWFVHGVALIDSRLREVLSKEASRGSGMSWWRSHFPTVSGPELAADLEELYGFSVSRIVR